MTFQHPAKAAPLAVLRDALGMRHLPAPRPEIGETDTRRCVWSVRELDAVHARTGGTVTARQVERASGDGSAYAVIEVTVTVDVPGVGPVEMFTDWQPAVEPYALALPVVRALHPALAAIEPTVRDAAREDREYWTDRYDHAS